MGATLKDTIGKTFLARVEQTPEQVAFQYKPTGEKNLNQWRQITFQRFYHQVEELSCAWMREGLEPGDRVAIIAQTRFECCLLDLSLLGASAVSVPLSPSLTALEKEKILNHCEASMVVVENRFQLNELLELRRKNPKALLDLRKIILIDESISFEAEDDLIHITSIHEMVDEQEPSTLEEKLRFRENLLRSEADDLFTICYTSGTTGEAKGVMLTQGNFMSVLQDCYHALHPHVQIDHEVILTFLPYSHILGRLECLSVYTFGWRQCFAENSEQLMMNLREVSPTILFAAPIWLERICDKILEYIDQSSKTKSKVFNWAFDQGYDFYTKISQGERPRLRDWATFSISKTLVLRRILNLFGGKIKFIISGGSALSQEVNEVLQGAGIQVLQGYGLTETCGPVTLNTPEANASGSAGRPFSEVDLRFSDEGEIWIRSEKLFKGYYKDPLRTQRVLEEGWFKTGDMGRLDESGFLQIDERKKDLITLANGKVVWPQKVENLAMKDRYIRQFVVQGEGQEELTALVTLAQDQIIKFAGENHILFSEYSELVKHPSIQSMVRSGIERMNAQLEPHEAIRRFLILASEFTIKTGELTPSLKIRRSFVRQKYWSEIQQLYSESPPLIS